MLCLSWSQWLKTNFHQSPHPAIHHPIRYQICSEAPMGFPSLRRLPWGGTPSILHFNNNPSLLLCAVVDVWTCNNVCKDCLVNVRGLLHDVLCDRPLWRRLLSLPWSQPSFTCFGKCQHWHILSRCIKQMLITILRQAWGVQGVKCWSCGWYNGEIIIQWTKPWGVGVIPHLSPPWVPVPSMHCRQHPQTFHTKPKQGFLRNICSRTSLFGDHEFRFPVLWLQTNM